MKYIIDEEELLELMKTNECGLLTLDKFDIFQRIEDFLKSKNPVEEIGDKVRPGTLGKLADRTKYKLYIERKDK